MYKSVLSVLFTGILFILPACGSRSISCMPACPTPDDVRAMISTYRANARELMADATSQHNGSMRLRAQLALDRVSQAQYAKDSPKEQLELLAEARGYLNGTLKPSGLDI